MMADSQVMAFWDVAEIDDPDVVTQMVENQVDEMAKGRAVFWAIRTLAEGASSAPAISPISTGVTSAPRWASCWTGRAGGTAMLRKP